MEKFFAFLRSKISETVGINTAFLAGINTDIAILFKKVPKYLFL